MNLKGVEMKMSYKKAHSGAGGGSKSYGLNGAKTAPPAAKHGSAPDKVAPRPKK